MLFSYVKHAPSNFCFITKVKKIPFRWVNLIIFVYYISLYSKKFKNNKMAKKWSKKAQIQKIRPLYFMKLLKFKL